MISKWTAISTLSLGFVWVACTETTSDSVLPVAQQGPTADADAAAPSVPMISVKVAPSAVGMVQGASHTFTCTVSGSTNTACTWSITEANGGNVTSSGAYTAPGAPGTFHLVATSSADAKASATATVTVTAPIVGCSGPVGKWQNITPPLLHSDQWCMPGEAKQNCPGAGNVSLAQVLGGYSGQISTYGAGAFAVDRNHPGASLLGTSSLGIWKSADCGATWAQADTGTNSDKIDGGRQNALIIDPSNSDIVYAGALYGAGNIWQSLDGGKSWQAIITGSGVVAALPYGGFLSGLTMDPDDHNHLASSPHAVCSGMALPGSQLVGAGTHPSTLVSGCTASAAPDGPVTGNCPVTPSADYSGWSCLIDGHYSNSHWSWTLVPNGVPWGGDGGGITIVSGNRWLYGGGQPDVYLTANGGGQVADGKPPWQKVFDGGGISNFYRASNNMLFTATGTTIKYSADDGWNWKDANLGGGLTSFVDDGTTMYIAGGFFGPNNTYMTSPLTDLVGPSPTTAPLAAPLPPGAITNGGTLDYDPNFHILYSANGEGGMWRMVLK